MSDLTKDDLNVNPIWEYWIEGRMEFVRPSKKTEISTTDSLSYIVLTSFIFNNGEIVAGFSSPMDSSGLDYIQPTVFTENGQVNFWRDNGWTDEEMQDAMHKIGFSRSSIFPIKYRTMVRCDNELYIGIIKDFNIGE